VRAVLAFCIFCLLSGSMYLINDVRDRENDRRHPVKRFRPVAAGRLTPRAAITAAVGILVVSLALALALGPAFLMTALAYVALITVYTHGLKDVPILDVLVIAGGFVVRAVAGAVAIPVEISSWFLLCTTFLALFLALCKRRHELSSLGADALDHRAVLSHYSVALLDEMIALVAAGTVLSYCLYTMSAETVAKFGTRYLELTIPFVLYGVFRYLYLVHQRDAGGRPEVALLTDRPLLVNIALWLLVAVLVVYLSPHGR
jgi:4-hydroxybenzoate polyprenyltransferase